MVLEFTARAVASDEDESENYRTAALAEQDDGEGLQFIFQSCIDEPDESDIETGMDTHCLVTADQATAYGCVKQAVLEGSILRLVFHEESLEDLGLPDSEVHVTLEAEEEEIREFGDVLSNILAYGRLGSRVELRRLG